jgi:uncharacterized protein with HEPN domain
MRRDPQRLKDILEALDWIANAIRNETRDSFVANEMLRYAVGQQLIVVGEAAASLSPELKSRNKHIVWRRVVGLRNVLAHQYFGISWELVWETAFDHGPVLRAQVAEILALEPDE